MLTDCMLVAANYVGLTGEELVWSLAVVALHNIDSNYNMENDAIESAKQILPTFTEEDIYVLSPSLVSLIRRTLKIDMEPLPKYLSSARQLMRVMLEVHLHDLNAPLVMLERCNSEADFEAVVRMCYDYLLLTPRLSHQEIRNIC